MFKLEFETDNDAFHPSKRREIVSILEELANTLSKSHDQMSNGGGKIRDTNGNTIGHWELS
jgi:hypothetical protein